jgi:two-component system sensor histidine kinase KdpD
MSPRRLRQSLFRLTDRRLFAGYAVAAVATAFATGLVALVRVEFQVDNIAMIYLLAVLAVAVLYGTGPAVAVSVGAFLAFNFFFVAPRYQFTVADEEEWLSLSLLLVTGIVAGRLAASLRERAQQAERREREAVVLYDVVRLMAEPELQRALTGVAERLRNELNVAAVLIGFGRDQSLRAQADTGEPESLALARDALRLPAMFLTRGSAPTGATRAQTGRWIKVVPPTRRIPGSERVRRVPILLGGEEVGAIILVVRSGSSLFTREEDRLLSTVAHQLGLTLEKLRLQREANEAEILRRTDELRAALMNAVSHDLRTPLSSIMASAGSLLQEEVTWTPEEQREFLHAIEGEAERLNRLVGNLLDLSRIEAGSLKPEKGWYDLGGLINEVAGRLRLLAAQHNLVIDVPELPPLEFDYVEIDQVLTNLIENAVKYTPPGSTITVNARRRHDVVEVEVADDGPGIPRDAVPRLFDAFYRAPSAGPRPQGSGLGLAVARGLIEAHGGRIRAENRPEGGARFSFTLPVAIPAAAPAETEKAL